MITLSGFADEISQDLTEQLDTLDHLSIRFLELRGVWSKNVLDLNDEELARVQAELDQHGIGVSAIGSPIGKAPIGCDFEVYKERVQRAIDVARTLRSSYIRVFSFYCEDLDRDRLEVMRRMQAMVDMAAAQGVTLLHENEKGIYGEQPERCLDLHQMVQGAAFKATFDPANFVQAGVRPFDQAYPMLKPYIAYWHIKDAVMGEGRVVPAGQGDGQLHQLLAAVRNTGFEGFMSLEPHLKVAGHSMGFTGPQLFETAVQALRDLLNELDMPFN